MLAHALSSALGRSLNRDEKLSPMAVTVVRMGTRGVLLLAVGLARQGLPRLTLRNWAIVLWLAVVNSGWPTRYGTAACTRYRRWNRA